MREVALAAVGLVFGLAAARWLPHPPLIALMLAAPLLFITDLTRRRLPEVITIPWFAYEAVCGIAALPYSLAGLMATVLVGIAGMAIVIAGARERRSLFGMGDVLAIASIQLALSDTRAFWPITFPAIAIAAMFFALLLARVDQTRRLGAPFGGALAAVAMSVCLPIIAR